MRQWPKALCLYAYIYKLVWQLFIKYHGDTEWNDSESIATVVNISVDVYHRTGEVVLTSIGMSKISW